MDQFDYLENYLMSSSVPKVPFSHCLVETYQKKTPKNTNKQTHLSTSAKIKKSDWNSVMKHKNWDIKPLLVGKLLVKLTE